MPIILAVLGMFAGWNALSAPCDIGPAAYKAEEALKSVEENYSGARHWVSSGIGTCRLGWAEKLNGYRKPNVSYSINCGPVFKFQSEKQMKAFSKKLIAQRLSFQVVHDIFASTSVPVCGELVD